MPGVQGLRRATVRRCLLGLALAWLPAGAQPARACLQEPRATLSVEAATYLAEALAVIREASFHRERIDWTRIRREAFAAAAGAEVPADTYSALRGALQALGDHHSFLQLPAHLAQLESERAVLRGRPPPMPPELGAAPPPSPFHERRRVEAHLHTSAAGPLARLVIPCFSGADVDAFAREIQARLAELDRSGPRGWIVDVRGNGGGNMWPMLAGVGPLLGDGRMGSFLRLDGPAGHWFYRAGAAGIEDDGAEPLVVASVAQPHVLTGTPPLPRVVVLIDSGTASSGEAVAIAFKGRPRTRFIGTPTYGLSSSNEGFGLSDGANLVITVGLDVDRTGHAYPDQVLPDEEVASPTDPEADDLQLARALAWLGEDSDR